MLWYSKRPSLHNMHAYCIWNWKCIFQRLLHCNLHLKFSISLSLMNGKKKTSYHLHFQLNHKKKHFNSLSRFNIIFVYTFFMVFHHQLQQKHFFCMTHSKGIRRILIIILQQLLLSSMIYRWCNNNTMIVFNLKIIL